MRCELISQWSRRQIRQSVRAALEEMSQRWRAVTVPGLTSPRFEPQTSRPRGKHVTARPTGRLIPFRSKQNTRIVMQACKIKIPNDIDDPSFYEAIKKYEKNDDRVFY